MLSRIAESLFWIGRYIERSDGTARLLDVHLQLLLEDPWVEESSACEALLGVMGSAPQTFATLRRSDVLRLLGTDRTQPSSIGSSLWAARENARGARDVLPTEVWEAINTTVTRSPRQVQQEKAHDYFRWVRERAALVFGLIESNVSRDDAWRLITLGRCLEHVDMTARLLATRSLTEASGPSWTTILRSCGGYQAYQHTYRGLPSAQHAAEFLLLDRLFPRSIVFSLNLASECLRGLDPTPTRVGVGARAQRALGQIRSELEYAAIDDVLADLPGYMALVQTATLGAAEGIRDRFFPVNPDPSWVGESA
ncbi:alpha-E domain-containing protein [Pseudoclavibacter soli]|uniref:alpha-E domain-containing protein n=1 Tax=Pseudoclavibacter soli TaxID=452623 RepID=UPI00040D6954|nr:alpha-E domain-containing protein [Pseudoclavibacter soli]